MKRRIVIVQGHPDPAGSHLGNALDAAYEQGALRAKHEVKRVVVATCDFPLIRSAHEWREGTPPPAIAEAQAAIEWANHIVLFYPLWLGDVPGLLKAFLEQVARPSFAFSGDDPQAMRAKRLTGKSARIVVTMGMPGSVYRWYFGAHSLKSLERNVFNFVGITPVRATVLGGVETVTDRRRRGWLKGMERLGRKAR